MTISELFEEYLAVAKANDWRQFHTPKNLASAVNVEAGELLEHFQWLQPGELPEDLEKVGGEIADTFMYLVALCDSLNLDIEDVLKTKVAQNSQRFLDGADS